MQNNKLAENLIIEIFAYALNRRNTFEIMVAHLKYQYLQNEVEKKFWQFLTENYLKTNRVATVGQIQQNFLKDDDVLELLSDIKDVDIDEKTGHETIIEEFENFVMFLKLVDYNEQIVKTYNRGDKHKAVALFKNFALDISKFSIKENKFETVFSDYKTRQFKRKSEDNSYRFRIPTMIDGLDYRLGGNNGGVETGECVLWTGDSGSGKSQAMVHLGIMSARQGYRVAHFQLEGTREQCLNRYDAAWTGTMYHDMKKGDVDFEKEKMLNKVIERLRRNDIIVSSEERFGGKTLADLRNELREMEKIHGKVDVIIIDYLELLEVGDGHNYSPSEERFRQTKLARAMKMIAMEFNCVVHTNTQATSIPEEQKNDPDFVITRYNLSEDKGKIRPFDIHITINQTADERKEQRMRLHTDKLREHASGEQITIYNNFSYSRFYDRKKTMEYIID